MRINFVEEQLAANRRMLDWALVETAMENDRHKLTSMADQAWAENLEEIREAGATVDRQLLIGFYFGNCAAQTLLQEMLTGLPGHRMLVAGAMGAISTSSITLLEQLQQMGA